MTLAALFHIAFYRFVRIDDPAHVAALLREFAGGLHGSMLLAREGINGMLSGSGAALDRFEDALRGDARLAGLFEGLGCRRTACAVAPFRRLKVHVRAEILPLGLPGVDPVGRRGIQLDPAQWRQLLDTPGTIVIDNRNGFEFRLGRFRGAIDPQVGNFRDLPAFVTAHAAGWKAEGRRVAMYCTGGIRCEKTAVWMHDAFGLDVAQLEGGILRYLAETPDAGRDWDGECFVFDNRVSLDVALQPGAARLTDVYGEGPDEAWRLQRAQRLAARAVMSPAQKPLPLPTREGVGPSCVALPEGPWATIADFLVERFAGVAPQAWAARIAAGDVVDAAGRPVTAQRPYEPALKVYYYRDPPAEPEWPQTERVLYRDEHIVVADKPHFMPVTPAGRHLHQTLLVRLKRRLGIDTLAPVHRIDRETAGLVLFTIDPATRGRYQRLFAERAVEKRYECIAPWRPEMQAPRTHRSRLVDDAAHFMRMAEVEGAANAETRLRMLARRDALARYELVPTTGRRHQLRVHCAALGMPIVGDRIYPDLRPAGTDDPAQPLALLAAALAFDDPVTGAARRFETALRLEWPSPRPSSHPPSHQ